MAGNVFKTAESVALAKSIAQRQGITVLSTKQDVLPHARNGKIVLPDATLYNHEQYMEHLHTAIGQVCPENSFFDAVSPETADKEQAARQQTHLDIIRDMHCDRYMNGEYEGRDRQLASGYKRRHERISQHLPSIARQDPTAAALLYAGNNCRNQWQGYNKLECPPEAKEVLDRMPDLEERWMSLETESDLKNLLKYIQENEYEQQQQSGGESQEDQQDGGEGSDSSGDGGASSQRSGDSRSDGSGSGSDDDSNGSDGGQGEAEGDSSGNQGGSGEDGGSGEGDSDSSGGSGDSGEGGDEQGDQSASGSGDETEADDRGDEGGDQDSEGSTGEGTSGSYSNKEGSGEKKAPPQSDSKPGFGDAGSAVRGLGLIGDPPDSKIPEPPPAPYTPTNQMDLVDARRKQSTNTTQAGQLMKELEGFKLSRKVRKYLIALAQTRYEYGLKQGRLAASKIGKMYSHTGHGQPRMYKKRTASQIKTDIAMTLVIDQSGSMRGDKFRVASACAIGMSEVLQAINVPHEILTFTSGYTSIINTIIKSFDERYVKRDKLARRLCRNNARMGANADGESIMWAVGRLAQRQEKDKVAIVCSDGSPAFSGGRGDDSQYLKDVVKSIEDTPGMDILGLGIMDSSVTRYYSRNRVIRNLASLETAFMDLLKEKMIR